MNKLLTSAAMLGVIATAATTAQADMTAAEGKVKCYGISAAGKNDCKASDGSHSCAGQAKKANEKTDWKYATAEECADGKGSETAPVAATKEVK